MPPTDAPAAPKGTARRDLLLELQNKAQKKWAEKKAYEVDAPEGEWDGGKFMVTFPYPYMNGKLHLGHAFSLSKAEFAVAYQRMLGKKALFPFAFHCTGMPIQAAACKLQKEYKLYGSPLPNFPPSPPEVVGAMDADNGAVTIGWKAPTCTGGKTLTGFTIYVRSGPPETAQYAKFSTVDATGAAPGAQFDATVTGLTVGQNIGFIVESIVEGGGAVKSKALDKSEDGKHALALLAPKSDKGEKKSGGGKPTGKPAAKIVAKTGGMMTQWDILRSMGLSVEGASERLDPLLPLDRPLPTSPCCPPCQLVSTFHPLLGPFCLGPFCLDPCLLAHPEVAGSKPRSQSASPSRTPSIG